MFPPDPPEEPPEEVLEMMRRADEVLVEALQAAGIYVEARFVAAQDPGQPGGPKVGLMMAGRVGDVAFSDRVLKPETVSDDEVLQDIADATVVDEFERLRRELLGGTDG